MASSEVFSKRPLDKNSKQIRLIQILPGRSSSVIACKFSVHTLEQSPPYTALSYAWGDSVADKMITISGAPFYVRENLWQFLHQERKCKRLGLLWIDAVCIDQLNTSERSQQVVVMKSIYSNVSILYL